MDVIERPERSGRSRSRVMRTAAAVENHFLEPAAK